VEDGEYPEDGREHHEHGQAVVPVIRITRERTRRKPNERSIYSSVGEDSRCRRGRGAFAQTRPEDLIKAALNGLIERTPGVEKKDVEDILVGGAFPEAEQGLNIGRIIAQMAKFPDDTCGATVNRFCASGLEAISLQAMRIMAGMCDVAIGAGLESMSIVPMGGNMPRPHPEWAKENPDVYISMGMTAENVANRYKITREMQDRFGYSSQMKAAQAQKNGGSRR
jgi:acetyl-CoA acyltransferase